MIEIRPLRPEDNRDGFSSGDVDLDRFFRKFAGQNQFRLHIGATYVAVSDGDILGFLTVAATSIRIDQLPAGKRNRLPNYPLPALRLARMAVSESAQGQSVGKQLLKAAFAIAREMADRTGCIGVLVDAKSAAVAFYERYGFVPLEVTTGQLGDRPVPLSMFLPLGSIPD